MSIPFVSAAEAEPLLNWTDLAQAMADGHALPKAEIGDTFLYRDPDTLLSRSAWIDGLGLAVKTATIFPGNPDQGKPMVNGAVCLYSDRDGTVSALVDFHLVTKWKTAADSLLAAQRLARPDSRSILIVGAGTVGASLREAFAAGFPDARFQIWNRTFEKAEALAGSYTNTQAVSDLEAAVKSADIIVSATMAYEPLIKGDWLQPGQHVNLIGAYRPDMRETDDHAITRARLFVDSYDTTLGHIGEIKIPLESGLITREDILADYYDLDRFAPPTGDEITLFKNGGGAHLDLMTSHHIFTKWLATQ